MLAILAPIQLLPSVPNVIKWFGAMLAATAALIAAYRFLLQRPQLRILADDRYARVKDERVKVQMRFNITNVGLGFASDAYVEFSLDDWNFGQVLQEESSGVQQQIEVQADTDSHDRDANTKNSSSPTYVDKILRIIDFLSEISTEWMTNEQTNFWSRDNLRDEESERDDDYEKDEVGIRFSETFLDTKHDSTYYIGAAGEVNQIFINDTLYAGSEFLLFWATAELERFRSYELNYRVACKTHGPASGTIKLHIGYDDVSIENDSPRFWWARVTDVMKQVRSLIPSSSEEPLQLAQIVSTEVDREYVSFHQTVLEPKAVVQTYCSGAELLTVMAKATLYMGEKEDSNIVGTITHTAHSLQSGDRWETTYLPRYRSRSTVAWESHLPHVLSAPPTLWSPHLEPFPWNPSAQLQVDWSIDYNVSEKPDLLGINVTEQELISNNSNSIGHIPVRAEGELTNTTAGKNAVFVIAKFHSRGGTIITTNHKLVRIEGNDDANFRVNAGLAPKQELQVENCTIVLRNDLG